MYWTDRMAGRVSKCNKFDCAGRNVVVSFILRPLGIAIMHPARQAILPQGLYAGISCEFSMKVHVALIDTILISSLG